jgi:hypothetical protein
MMPQFVCRESSSGTLSSFKEHVVKEIFFQYSNPLPGTAAANAVSKDKYSVGYGGAGLCRRGKRL